MNQAVDALLEELVKYIQTAMPELAEVYPEWPEANQVLDMPALTIFSNKPTFTNLDPYKWRASEIREDKTMITDWIVGSYDMTMQLDLWCRNKAERSKLYEKLFSVLNPVVIPMGLSLKLPNYYDTIARLDVSGVEMDDNEPVAQRREWRAKVNLLAHCKSVLPTTDYGIVTIETLVETPDNIPKP